VDAELLYISTDGLHKIAGNLYEVKDSDDITNLTSQRRTELRKERNPMRQKAINAVDETEMVVFAPTNGTKHTINVFTDVDCPYCAKFHQEVPALNEAGIKVRYLAFPRAGAGSATYNTMVSVWCAKDRQQAMTDAKAGHEIEAAECNHPVDKQYDLGQHIGITGTPALVLSNGKLIPGYMPASELISLLDE
jgi:thiol:disulfide interchange protein DsbC